MKLENIWDIRNISDGIITSKEGHLTVGFKLMLTEMYTSEEHEQERLDNTIARLIQMLEGCRIQIHSNYYSDYYNSEIDEEDTITIKKNKFFFDQKPLLKSYQTLYITFPKSELTGVSNVYRWVDYFTKPIPTVKKELFDKVMQRTKQVEMFLQGSAGISGIRMDDQDLKSAIVGFHKGDIGTDWFENSENVKLDPTDFKTNKIGSRTIRVLRLAKDGELVQKRQYAKLSKVTDNEDIDYKENRELKTSYLFPVAAGLPIPHIIVTTIDIPSNETITKEIKKKFWAVSKIALGSRLREHVAASHQYVDDLDDLEFKGVKMNMMIILQDQTEAKLKDYETLITTAFLKMNGGTLVTENRKTLPMFYSCMPGNAYAIEKDKMLYSYSGIASCYIPLETYYYNDRNGYITLDPFNNPVQIDIRNPKYITAPNGFIFGASGYGKTFKMQDLMDNGLSNGEDCVIINTKDDYKKFVEIHKGVYFDSAEMEGFNPFLCMKDELGFYAPGEDHLYMIEEILTILWKGDAEIKRVEQALLKETLVQYYEYVNKENQFPIFNGFYEFTVKFEKDISDNKEYKNQEGKLFIDYNDLRQCLKDFYSGSNKHVLNSTKDIDIINERLVCFDLGAVVQNPLLFKLYLSYCFTISTRKIFHNHKHGGFTNIYVDECIDSLEGKGGRTIGEYYRKNRSLSGAVFISTQDVKFLNAAEELVRDSITTNAKIKIIIGPQSKTSLDFFQKHMGITDHHVEMINSFEADRSKPYREYILILDEYARIFRTRVSDYTKYVYTTKKEEVREIKEIWERVGSLPTAINIYVEQNIKA